VARAYSALEARTHPDTVLTAQVVGESTGVVQTLGSDSALFQDSRERITTLIPLLYQRLNAVCGGGVGEGRDNILLEELRGQKWIWVGDSFVPPNRVALTTSVNATPYLYQLPQDLRVYGKLLGSFGIKRVFTPRDYIQVLREMYDSSSVSIPEKPGDDTVPPASVCALSDAKIDLAVSLVTLLSSEGEIDANVHAIYAPDSTGRLGHSITLINDDVPWLSGPEYASTRTGCRFIHPNISSTVAQRLGEASFGVLSLLPLTCSPCYSSLCLSSAL
jgi:hypothetical protein